MSDTLISDTHWYLGGVSSAVANLFTHPADLVRIQVLANFNKKSPRQILKVIRIKRGNIGLYHGIVASSQNQFSYGLSRFGIYDYMKSKGLTQTFWERMEFTILSGFLAGFINSPIEKVNIRIRTDVIRQEPMRRNYKHMFHGLSQIYKIGGIRFLFGEALISGFRGSLITVAQILVYEQVKLYILQQNKVKYEYWETVFISSLTAGAISSFATMPIDIVKIIGMNARYGSFSGSMNIARAIKHKYGLLGFYRGILPSILRYVPHTVLTFLIYEELHTCLKKFNFCA